MADQEKDPVGESFSNLKSPEMPDADRMQSAERFFEEMAGAPDRHTTLVRAVRSAEMSSLLAAHIAREAIRKMTAEDREWLANSELPRGETGRDRLWLIVIYAFALVLVLSFLSIFVLAILAASCKEAKVDATAQMLLTVFTTSVGFLSGLFAPNPLERTNRAPAPVGLPPLPVPGTPSAVTAEQAARHDNESPPKAT